MGPVAAVLGANSDRLLDVERQEAGTGSRRVGTQERSGQLLEAGGGGTVAPE